MMLNRCCERVPTWDDLVVKIWRSVELAEARTAILRQADTRFAGIRRRCARCEARICFIVMLYVSCPSGVAREGLEAEIWACAEPAAMPAAVQPNADEAGVRHHMAKIFVNKDVQWVPKRISTWTSPVVTHLSTTHA